MAGFKICDIKIEEKIEKLAVINLMGQFAMPLVENPFNWATKLIKNLEEQNIKNIFVDFHGEATGEKELCL